MSISNLECNYCFKPITPEQAEEVYKAHDEQRCNAVLHPDCLRESWRYIPNLRGKCGQCQGRVRLEIIEEVSEPSSQKAVRVAKKFLGGAIFTPVMLLYILFTLSTMSAEHRFRRAREYVDSFENRQFLSYLLRIGEDALRQGTAVIAEGMAMGYNGIQIGNNNKYDQAADFFLIYFSGLSAFGISALYNAFCLFLGDGLDLGASLKNATLCVGLFGAVTAALIEMQRSHEPPFRNQSPLYQELQAMIMHTLNERNPEVMHVLDEQHGL